MTSSHYKASSFLLSCINLAPSWSQQVWHEIPWYGGDGRHVLPLEHHHQRSLRCAGAYSATNFWLVCINRDYRCSGVLPIYLGASAQSMKGAFVVCTRLRSTFISISSGLIWFDHHRCSHLFRDGECDREGIFSPLADPAVIYRQALQCRRTISTEVPGNRQNFQPLRWYQAVFHTSCPCPLKSTSVGRQSLYPTFVQAFEHIPT